MSEIGQPGAGQKPAAVKWLMPAKVPEQRKLTLWCFPFAGGGGSAFHGLRRLAPSWLAVQSVQLPGRESRIREPSFTDLKKMTAELADALPSVMTGPIAFLGYSMGCLIAFELARELRRRGLPGPVHLFIAAYRAPQIPNALAEMHGLPDEELRREAQARFGQTNDALSDPALAKLLLPILRADLQLCETYAHEEDAPLACPISILGGSADHIVPPPQLEGWRNHSAGATEVQLFPGSHFFLFQNPEPGFTWACQRLASHAGITA